MSRSGDRISDASFTMMTATFAIVGFFSPTVANWARTFGIWEGMTPVDYGCGPGRYTVELARLVG